MTKRIDIEFLKQLHNTKVSIACRPNSGYGNIPKPLFLKNGNFNPDNWSGGDAIIRNFIDYISENDITRLIYEEIEYDNNEYDIICNWSKVNEHQFMSIIINCVDLNTTNVVLIRIYKNRGHIELLKYNGNDIKIDQYVFLLNLLQTTGFNFFA